MSTKDKNSSYKGRFFSEKKDASFSILDVFLKVIKKKNGKIVFRFLKATINIILELDMMYSILFFVQSNNWSTVVAIGSILFTPCLNYFGFSCFFQIFLFILTYSISVTFVSLVVKRKIGSVANCNVAEMTYNVSSSTKFLVKNLLTALKK